MITSRSKSVRLAQALSLTASAMSAVAAGALAATYAVSKMRDSFGPVQRDDWRGRGKQRARRPK